MANHPTLLQPQLIAELQGLQLRARAVVESVLAGTHRSTRRGFSVEFAEHRDYVPGDDVRYIDWKLFARRDRYYVRQFEDETRFKLLCVLDISPSMTYRSAQSALSKLEYAAVLAATMLSLVQQQRDEYGLACFDQTLNVWSPPSLQSGWLPQLIAQLEAATANVLQTPPANARDTTAPEVNWQPLHDIAERLPPRSLIVLFTDGFGDLQELSRALLHVRHRRQDLRLIQVLDPAEVDFPFQEPTRFLGLETGTTLALPPHSIRDSYLKEFQAFLKQLETTCQQQHCTYQRLATSSPLDLAVRRMLEVGD